MRQQNFKLYFAIAITVIFALVFTIFPLPKGLWWLRPHWVTLVLIYWILNFPKRVGIIFGFTIGLLLDLLNGVTLGSTGLVLSCIAFLVVLLQANLRQCRFWQRLIVVMMLVGFEQLLALWIQLALGNKTIGPWYWFPTMLTIISWPLLALLLQFVQKKFNLRS